MRKIKEFLFWFSVFIVRRITSRIIYVYYTKTGKLIPEHPGLAKNVLRESLDDFSALLEQLPYQHDPKLRDFTLYDPDLYFNDDPIGRDCDDTAWMWFLWAKTHQLNAWYVAITDANTFESMIKRGHYVTVVHIDGKYHLMNYTDVGQYDSFEDAIKQFEKRQLVSGGKYTDVIYAITDIN